MAFLILAAAGSWASQTPQARESQHLAFLWLPPTPLPQPLPAPYEAGSRFPCVSGGAGQSRTISSQGKRKKGKTVPSSYRSENTIDSLRILQVLNTNVRCFTLIGVEGFLVCLFFEAGGMERRGKAGHCQR